MLETLIDDPAYSSYVLLGQQAERKEKEGAVGPGGGYSGGGATSSTGVTGGGGSYNAGSNPYAVEGHNEGHGKVIIKFK